jgi:hypothetical protein
MCAGIEQAIAQDYDSVAFIETDLLFARSVAEPIAAMRAAGKHFAQTLTPARGFRESDLFFADVAWLRESRFVERYDWRAARPVCDGHPCPERKLMDLTDGAVHMLGYRGTRMNDSRVSHEECGRLDWLTHADRREYEAFLRGHGWGQLV